MNFFAYISSLVVLFSSLTCSHAKPPAPSKWDKMGEVGGVTLFINVYKKGDYNHVLWKVVNKNDCEIRFCPWSKTFTFSDKKTENTEEWMTLQPKATVEGKESVDDELSDSFFKKEVVTVEVQIEMELMEEEDEGPNIAVALGAV